MIKTGNEETAGGSTGSVGADNGSVAGEGQGGDTTENRMAGKRLRYGFTTGSCAAAAAKAAAYMLLTGTEKRKITIETPKGIPYTAEVEQIHRTEKEVSCAVRKDGGDDPDITSGALICARVSLAGGSAEAETGSAETETGSMGTDSAETETDRRDHDGRLEIWITGGIGVGTVTRPGLDQPPGNAAINHVPREMITKEVKEVCDLTDYRGRMTVEIYVPEGEKLAAHTFNPRLGIVGGISILGTSGIVEPMSSQALLDTIYVELSQRKAEGYAYAAVAPGNYGLDFMKKTYGYDLDKSVKCSNFIGKTIDMARELGFRRLLLTGHIGKLIKVAGGIMNTHSREGDCRMELLAAFSVKADVEPDSIKRILKCVTTEEAVTLLKEAGKLEPVMDYAMERICFYLEHRSGGRIKIDCIMYSNELGELAKSKEAEQWFTLLAQEQERRI